MTSNTTSSLSAPLPDVPAQPEPQHFEPIEWQVVGNNIIIEFEEDAAERTSVGGVILPGTKKEVRKSVATVVGVGPHAALEIPPRNPPGGPDTPLRNLQRHAAVGDVLVVHRHKLTKLELSADSERKLWVIDPSNVIGIIDAEPEIHTEQD